MKGIPVGEMECTNEEIIRMKPITVVYLHSKFVLVPLLFEFII